MSANPTRFDWRATTPDLGSPLQKGNRVLESIARQEALRALLAFSDLHQQIRNRRMASGNTLDRDLFETERFILDEVLQLICDRAEAITESDGVVIALVEGPGMVCRAASGERAIARGVPLIGESGLLRECLESGRILRCDDCESDARADFDFARILDARSTVLVPLRGQRQQLGVLQAFSAQVRAFSDHDVRCFDLFAELVLSALKPEDQDRRVDWLADVAGDVLRSRPVPAVSANPVVAPCEASETLETELARSHSSRPSVAEALPRICDFDIDPPSIATPSPDLDFVPSVPARSGAGWGRILMLLTVTGLLAAGTWWGVRVKGIQVREIAAAAKVAMAKAALSKHALRLAVPSSTSPPSTNTSQTSASPASEHRENSIPDDLTNGSNASSDVAMLVMGTKTATSKITGIRHWSSTAESTVVIDMEDEVPYEVHRLESPERVYFDLHSTALMPELEGKTMDVGDASLSRVRIGQPVPGITRVVLDTREGANFSVSMESNPYRLVVKLHGAEQTLATNRTAAKLPLANRSSLPARATPAEPKPAPVPALPMQASGPRLPAKTGRFRVVLDAGHGGWDLGTVGRHGLTEKDLVLDVTERLGKLLQARLGTEVVFTRTDDTYLPLDQRADIANQAQADLFVSVHANYSSSTSARGIETYYTNLFSAPGSREVEKHDDGSFMKLTPVTLSIDGLHEKIEESRRLAANVQRALYSTLVANSPGIRNRGIKDAAFVVLTGTTMPAILTEISFVSSPADERNLQSPAYRQQVAEALYQGIARYQQSSPRAKMAQLQTDTTRR